MLLTSPGNRFTHKKEGLTTQSTQMLSVCLFQSIQSTLFFLHSSHTEREGQREGKRGREREREEGERGRERGREEGGTGKRWRPAPTDFFAQNNMVAHRSTF